MSLEPRARRRSRRALGFDHGAHPLVRAAMAHLHLVSIHPWADGNGRMSRSLQTLMIGREGVLAPVGRTRARYYTAGSRFPEDALEIANTPMTLSDPYAG
ncbi:Fic family protein [Actinomadura sp. GTD37]|uniref:Fic family protein n=1 Tax=Actinomadura sp. GTD37 TaxID=1778030 RepID=UPI0035BF364E